MTRRGPSVDTNRMTRLEIVARLPGCLVTIAMNVAVVLIAIKLMGLWPAIVLYAAIAVLLGAGVASAWRRRSKL
jgi:hypothetical protein